MKLLAVIPLVAVARALVLLPAETLRDLAIEHDKHDETPWWAGLASEDSLASFLEDAADLVSEGVEEALRAAAHAFFGETGDDFIHDDGCGDESSVDADADADGPGRRRRHHHGFANRTIYQLISKSNYTTKFAKAVDQHPHLVDLLNGTDANYTLFVPLDSAFPDPPKGDPPADLLRYHIGLGRLEGRRHLATTTVPTALTEEQLGGQPQRLRLQLGLIGGRVNFRSRIVAANIGAKNGAIYAVNHVLVPPPTIARELSLVPSLFSTLLLAYEKTDFASFVDGIESSGGTVFAPTNAAFAHLGPAANAFLFNTDKGRAYLKALLKYQVVANATLYSDAFYGDNATAAADDARPPRHLHFQLPTLLHRRPLAVDIDRGPFGAFVRIRVNGHVPVVLQDGVARDGVVQVVGRVPIPPHGKHHRGGGGEDDADGELDVEDLMQRLAEYVDADHARVPQVPMGDL